MNARFAERHDDLMNALLLVVRDAVHCGLIDYRDAAPIMDSAATLTSGEVSAMREAIFAMLKCTPTQSR